MDKIKEAIKQKQSHNRIHKLLKILKKKGIPLSVKRVPLSQKEEFIQQILSEKVQLSDLNEDLVRALFKEELK